MVMDTKNPGLGRKIAESIIKFGGEMKEFMEII
jgi:hypothetical protein